MAEVISNPLEATVVRRSSWGAIWAGVFTFIAIWSVFGSLGFDIFFNNRAGGDVGMEVWGIILTIIAMFVAGRVTGTLAGVTEQREGVAHGIVMFGLSVVSVAVLLLIAGSAGTTVAATGAAVHPYAIEVLYSMGWALFVGLFLGWLAAIGGASTANRQLTSPSAMHQQVRHA